MCVCVQQLYFIYSIKLSIYFASLGAVCVLLACQCTFVPTSHLLECNTAMSGYEKHTRAPLQVTHMKTLTGPDLNKRGDICFLACLLLGSYHTSRCVSIAHTCWLIDSDLLSCAIGTMKIMTYCAGDKTCLPHNHLCMIALTPHGGPGQQGTPGQ